MFGYLASIAFYTNISKYIFDRMDENKSEIPITLIADIENLNKYVSVLS